MRLLLICILLLITYTSTLIGGLILLLIYDWAGNWEDGSVVGVWAIIEDSLSIIH